MLSVARHMAMRNTHEGTYKVKSCKDVLHGLSDACVCLVSNPSDSHVALTLMEWSMPVASLQPSVVDIESAISKDVSSRHTSRRANITSNAS